MAQDFQKLRQSPTIFCTAFVPHSTVTGSNEGNDKEFFE